MAMRISHPFVRFLPFSLSLLLSLIIWWCDALATLWLHLNSQDALQLVSPSNRRKNPNKGLKKRTRYNLILQINGG